MRKRSVKIPKALHTAFVETYSHDGRGIARIDGKTTFIQGALPDETVSFQYTIRKKDFDEGKMMEIQKPSPLRVEPHCAHYQVCGGCSLQHLDSVNQIKQKQEILLDLLARIGHAKNFAILKPLTANILNYRNKARLSVRYVEKKQSTLVGFRERYNPRYITEIDNCVVLNAKVDTDLLKLRSLIDSLENKACIAQVEVAAGDTEVALIFRNLDVLNTSDENKLKAFGEQFNYKIFMQPGNESTVYPLNLQDSSFLTYALPDHKIIFQFHPTDFTQINPELNQKMVNLALELLDLKKEDTVLDLFCGLGNFSLPIARYCQSVVGVEGSETMVERASMNAKSNEITNAEFFAANLEENEALRPFSSRKFNKILIDPPRLGALSIVNNIEQINPDSIVYVSCNPVTLARDAQILIHEKGYVLKSAGVMDMFPHTQHVESIALFVKE